MFPDFSQLSEIGPKVAALTKSVEELIAIEKANGELMAQLLQQMKDKNGT